MLTEHERGLYFITFSEEKDLCGIFQQSTKSFDYSERGLELFQHNSNTILHIFLQWIQIGSIPTDLNPLGCLQSGQ